MLRVSYSDLFGIRHEREWEEHIAEGDMVSTGSNAGPFFRVLAVNDNRAWLRNVSNGMDGIVDVARCRKVNGAPASVYRAEA
jgi:hypothetical protein